MPRKPIGDVAMTGAERLRRFRERQRKQNPALSDRQKLAQARAEIERLKQEVAAAAKAAMRRSSQRAEAPSGPRCQPSGVAALTAASGTSKADNLVDDLAKFEPMNERKSVAGIVGMVGDCREQLERELALPWRHELRVVLAQALLPQLIGMMTSVCEVLRERDDDGVTRTPPPPPHFGIR